MLLENPPVRNPKILGKAIRLRAEGKSLQQTADAIGVDQSTVYRWEKRDDIKAAIEAESKRLLQLVPKAADTYKRIIEQAEQAQLQPHLVEYPLLDPEGKPILDAEGKPQTILAPASDKAIGNNIKLVTLAKEASADILQGAGILPGRAESRVINNFFIAGSGEQLAPMIGALLGRAPAAEPEPAAIDASFEAVEEADPE